MIRTILTASIVSMAATAAIAQAPARRTVAEGVFNKDQAARGQAKYSRPAATATRRDLAGSDPAPGLAGGDFLDRWQGQSVGDLADRIRTSMPADDVGSLNVQMLRRSHGVSSAGEQFPRRLVRVAGRSQRLEGDCHECVQMSASSSSSETRTLASYVVDSRLEDIPADVRHEARRAIVNYMGCALGGATHPAMDITLRALGPFAGAADGGGPRPRRSASIRCTPR